jgi:CheY-like chemotaxis protein
MLCKTAEQAMAALKQMDPDIILMDYQLSKDGMNGLDLITACREIAHQQIPAILVTALRDKDLRKEAADMQVQYLPKPVRPAALRALINKLTKDI